jgi:dTDP-4-amino-4,6-dideoxygalactose transaminase
MFGLPETVVPEVENNPDQWKFLKDSNLFLANARSGISILIDLLRPENIWMPSYFCPTMIDALTQKKINLRYYRIDYNLQITSADWIKKIQVGDIVVLIDYFGFPLDSNIATLVKKHGGQILEDACQALLCKHVGQHADFILFSPRKFIGVPDGGILVSCREAIFDDVRLEAAPASWWLTMLEATINRREFDKYGGKRRWYQLSQDVKATMPCGYYAMSDLSRQLLCTRFDYSDIAKKRIDNYLVLAPMLKDIALFPTLLKETVPLGFPVRDCRRNVIRDKLFQEQIYPPVHWLLDKVTPNKFHESHNLSDNIMTLPCDQRYDKSDMERIAQIVLENL